MIEPTNTARVRIVVSTTGRIVPDSSARIFTAHQLRDSGLGDGMFIWLRIYDIGCPSRVPISAA